MNTVIRAYQPVVLSEHTDQVVVRLLTCSGVDFLATFDREEGVLIARPLVSGDEPDYGGKRSWEVLCDALRAAGCPQPEDCATYSMTLVEDLLGAQVEEVRWL